MDDEQVVTSEPGSESEAAAELEPQDWGDWLEAQAGWGGNEPAAEPVGGAQVAPVAEQPQEPEETQPGVVSAWQPALELLQQLQVDPAAFVQHLQRQQTLTQGQQPQAPQTPEDRFAAWLVEHEVDPDGCTRAELLSLQGVWQQQEMFGALQAQQEQAQEQAMRAQWQSDLQGLETAHPAFRNPVLRDAVLNTYESRYGIEPNAERLLALAAEQAGAMEALTQARLAEYQQKKGADASFPVIAGGNSPPATTAPVDFHQLSPTLQQEYLETHFAATSGAGF